MRRWHTHITYGATCWQMDANAWVLTVTIQLPYSYHTVTIQLPYSYHWENVAFPHIRAIRKNPFP